VRALFLFDGDKPSHREIDQRGRDIANAGLIVNQRTRFAGMRIGEIMLELGLSVPPERRA